MKKRKLAVVLASVMLLGTSITALASNIEARGPSCPACGDGAYMSYKPFPVSKCRICGLSGCSEVWWGWQCESCNEFSRTSLKESVCRRI